MSDAVHNRQEGPAGGENASWTLHETFLAVMDEGSLSGAARLLGVAQPTVRRRIEALESALGALLFTRAPNGLLPTDAAHAALPHAQAIASHVHAFTRSASGSASEARGTVRIAASEVIGVEVLPGALDALLSSERALQVELVVSNRNEDLLRREADVAIRMVRPTQSSLIAKKVGDIPVGLYASCEYLAGVEAPSSAEDLHGHRLVGADRDRNVFEALAAYGLPHRRRDYHFRSDSDIAQLSAVRGGLGVGVCQVKLAARWPNLVRVLPSMTLNLEMWVVTHEDLRRVRRVCAVFDHLVQALGEFAD